MSDRPNIIWSNENLDYEDWRDSLAEDYPDLTEAQREALSKTRRPAWRVKVPEKTIAFRDFLYGNYSEDLKRDCGDFIVRRSDGVYAYQLAVVVDDAAMGVTQVVRGSDLLDSTPRQLWLQEELRLPHPEYGHVPLLLAPDGRRLAKRDRDQELGELQSRYTAPELVGRLAHLAGLIPEPPRSTRRSWFPCFPGKSSPKRTGPHPGSPAFRHLSQIVGNQQKALEKGRAFRYNEAHQSPASRTTVRRAFFRPGHSCLPRGGMCRERKTKERERIRHAKRHRSSNQQFHVHLPAHYHSAGRRILLHLPHPLHPVPDVPGVPAGGDRAP